MSPSKLVALGVLSCFHDRVKQLLNENRGLTKTGFPQSPQLVLIPPTDLHLLFQENEKLHSLCAQISVNVLF